MLKVMLIYTSILLDLYKWSILIVATKEYNIISTASFKSSKVKLIITLAALLAFNFLSIGACVVVLAVYHPLED